MLNGFRHFSSNYYEEEDTEKDEKGGNKKT